MLNANSSYNLIDSVLSAACPSHASNLEGRKSPLLSLPPVVV